MSGDWHPSDSFNYQDVHEPAPPGGATYHSPKPDDDDQHPSQGILASFLITDFQIESSTPEQASRAVTDTTNAEEALKVYNNEGLDTAGEDSLLDESKPKRIKFRVLLDFPDNYGAYTMRDQRDAIADTLVSMFAVTAEGIISDFAARMKSMQGPPHAFSHCEIQKHHKAWCDDPETRPDIPIRNRRGSFHRDRREVDLTFEACFDKLEELAGSKVPAEFAEVLVSFDFSRAVPGLPSELGRVHSLRTAKDSERFRAWEQRLKEVRENWRGQNSGGTGRRGHADSGGLEVLE